MSTVEESPAEADVLKSAEGRAYGRGYWDGFAAALDLPVDHPMLDGLLERLRADGWAEPGEVAS